MVQGVTLVFAIMVILVNLMADVAYAALDPRVQVLPVSVIPLTPESGPVPAVAAPCAARAGRAEGPALVHASPR